MATIQIRLSDDADKKVKLFMALNNFRNKGEAINNILEQIRFDDKNG